jgi:hypothetical protein
MPPPSLVTALAGAPHAFWNPFSAGSSEVIKWVVSGVTKAINSFFGDLVTSALNPLLKLLGQTLLTTPNVSSLPRVGQLWGNSRDIAVAVYALIILIAGILVMAYETVQTRHSIKEILPRLVTAFLTANLSLVLASQAVSFANAISTALLGQGVSSSSAASALTALVLGAVTHGGIFLVLIGLGVAGILLALLSGYVIRVAATVILIAAAPLALMCHALPQTEGVARWWWRAFTGVLAIQICQSLTLIAALNVFLGPGGFTFFGPSADGLVNLIVTFALLYILFKIPFWILHHIQTGGGRSFIGSAVKGVIAYKTLGLMGLGRGGAAHGAKRAGQGKTGGQAGGAGATQRPAAARRPSGSGAGRSTASRPAAGRAPARRSPGSGAPRVIPGQGVLPLDLSAQRRPAAPDRAKDKPTLTHLPADRSRPAQTAPPTRATPTRETRPSGGTR